MVAESALGRLSGGAIRAADFELLSSAIAIVESLNSSRVEGTQSTLDEVIAVEVSRDELRDEDLREVYNYLAAAERGRELLRELPISQRLFLDVQRVLLEGARGEEKTPGELRRSPVWVGKGQGPADAEYIPPLPHLLPELLSDWEHFVNESELPNVVWLALAHYQFETIHPLLDGNGRVGRILIELMLISRGLLPRVALGISGYIEANRSDYYRHLQGVREQGEIDGWIEFFATAVAVQATGSFELLKKLTHLRESFSKLLGDFALADCLIKNPKPTVAKVMQELGVSQPTASSYLRKAERLGIAKSLGQNGKGRKERWEITEVWCLIQDL